MGVHHVLEILLLLTAATNRDAPVKKSFFYHLLRYISLLIVLIELLLHITNFPVFLYIYNAVDCKWNDWIIGECTESCGGGTRIKTRTEKVSEAYGGAKCEGNATIEEPCNIQSCPSNKQQKIVTKLFLSILKIQTPTNT